MPSLAAGLLGGPGAGGGAAALQTQASREAIAEIQRQFGITQENIAPFLEAGQGAAPGVAQAAGIGGFGERLGELFGGGALDPLIAERTRAVQGGLAAGGLTRSGAGIRELADVPTNLGLQIENLLAGRGQQLFGQGQQAALGLGGLSGQAAGQQAGLLQGIGQAQSQGSLLDAQLRAQRNQQLIQGVGEAGSFLGGLLPTGGAGAGGGGLAEFFKQGQGLSVAESPFGTGAGGQVSSLFFSDPNLKENVEEIGAIGDLKVYQWDWIPETKDTLVALCGTIGFMADEVKKLYPKFVGTFGGFDIIDYEKLLNHLEVEYA